MLLEIEGHDTEGDSKERQTLSLSKLERKEVSDEKNRALVDPAH
jgi:hypothetical protein